MKPKTPDLMTMRKLGFILLAVIIGITAQAKDKTVIRPAFKSMTKDAILPVKVEQTKDATIVHFHLVCAANRNWSMDGAQLRVDGQTFACRQARIITHDGPVVLADEPFEFGKKIERDARKDSVILYFDPLPKDTKTFDYIEGENRNSWQIFGIRLDNKLYPSQLPPYQPREDDGKPLEPIALKYGDATVTITMHGDSIKGFGWFGDVSRDFITNEDKVQTTKTDSTIHFVQPAYSTVRPRFTGAKIEPNAPNGQFPMYLIPGETLTLDIDRTACLAWQYDFAAGKPSGRGYRVGGTVGDLNQVLLEHLDQFFFTLPELPRYDEVQDFPEWREKLWQNLDTLRQGMLLRSDYTRRQKDFFALMTDFTYLRALIEYYDILKWKNRTTTNPDSILAHLKKTYTLVDPHARELQFGRDGRSFYFPLEPEFLPYWEANGLVHSEVYEMTSNFAKAQTLGVEMKNTEVQTDSAIQSVHPYFQPILRAFNDTTRVFAERLQREAKDRIMTAPDVPGDQLLQAIAKQYPGKVVFFDLWATWCGPCKKGIEAMEPLKQQMKDKDVVFVYLTDESSPVGAWNSYVLKIPGLHYRIASLGALPGITGIPQYYLYDRQGQRVWEQTGFDAETLTIIEAEIQKALLH